MSIPPEFGWFVGFRFADSICMTRQCEERCIWSESNFNNLLSFSERLCSEYILLTALSYPPDGSEFSYLTYEETTQFLSQVRKSDIDDTELIVPSYPVLKTKFNDI